MTILCTLVIHQTKEGEFRSGVLSPVPPDFKLCWSMNSKVEVLDNQYAKLALSSSSFW